MKVGVVIVTHYRLGEEFLQALRLIVPDPPPFEAVSIDPKQGVEEMRRAIAAALVRVERGQGVLVLTDMFGGTPSNIALSFLAEHRVEVVTGVNLSMLLKLGTAASSGMSLSEIAELVCARGRESIQIPSRALRRPVRHDVPPGAAGHEGGR